MVPAVRSPDGTCVDESSCDYERMIACAFDTCADQDCSVDYLVCMDEGAATTAEIEGEKCCTSTDIDYTTVKACFDGDLGTQLLQAAADTFNAALPGSTYIPNTMIDGTTIDSNYDALESAMCSAGSEAAACSKLQAKKCVV
mmetsp:Transcript_35418/g.94971  ORF Transcript_35418/g.94971 Transcript_35418/m.94971 type:complete len:142 (-) Transcript_35418:348-773(-)